MRFADLVIALAVICLDRVATANTPTPTPTVEAYACIGNPTPKERQQTFESVDSTPNAEKAREKPNPFDRCYAPLDQDSDIASRRGGTLANSGSWVEVYFYREDAAKAKTVIPPSEAKFARVEISSGGGKPLITKAVAYGTTVDVPLSELDSLTHLSVVKVSIYYNELTKSVDRYFRIYKKFSGYGIAGKETYFWIPVGLFGTSFKKDDNGYSFSAFPVGIAVGERFAISDTFYLGGSLMLDYTIYRDPTGTGATTSNNVSLSGATLGALVDIDNFIYLGYGYIFDWKKDAKNPGSTFVIGAGPGLIQYLQGKH